MTEAPSAHRIELETTRARIRIEVGDETIADTREALELHETHSPVRYYIPERDVRMDLLERTDTSTHCPHKGDACYWSLQLRDIEVEDIAWAYLEPTDYKELAGMLSFYPGKVDRFLVEGEELIGRS